MLRKIVSFGFKHGWPPIHPGATVIDITHMFRNPWHNVRLRELTGQDQEVQDEICLTTSEFMAKYAYLKEQVQVPGTEVAYIGCHGGRHRSVFLAQKLGKELGVEVEHRDIFKR